MPPARRPWPRRSAVQVVALLAACVLLGIVTAGAVTDRLPGRTEKGGDGREAADGEDGCAREQPAARRLPRVRTTVGVASFNVDRTQRPRGIARDVRRLLSRPGLDVVGWQEADTAAFANAVRGQEPRGWRTRFFDAGDGSRQVPISWRAATFTLVSAEAHAMTAGAGRDETSHPFRPKWATSVTLRHRASGRSVTVLNIHVPNHIETGDRWQDNLNATEARRLYRRLSGLLAAPGEVRVATGDFQWDFVDDTRARPRGGITRTFAGRAVNSFQSLGLTGVCATRNSRWIDYVWLDAGSVDGRRADFVTHMSLDHYGSDHRPMTATIALLDER